MHESFRGYWDYDGGGLGDMGQHYLDPVQYLLEKDNTGPVEIEADAPQAHPDACGSWRKIYMKYADGCEIILDGESQNEHVPFIEGPHGKLYPGFESDIPDLKKKLQQFPEPEQQVTDFYQAVRTITRLRARYPDIKISTDFDILCPFEPVHPPPPSRASCPAGRSMLNVNYDGYVYPCAFLVTPEKEFAAGHLHGAPLLTLWRESPVWVPFRALEKGATCQRCAAYGQACVGGCVAVSYLATGRLDAHDPTCFMHLVSDVDMEGMGDGD